MALRRPTSLSASLLRRVYTSVAADSGATSAVSLGTVEAKLVDRVYSLLVEQHRSNPSPDPPTLALDIPALSSSLSSLSPTPIPSPVALSVVRRVSAVRHSAPFAPTVAFFNWWLGKSAETSSICELVDVYTELIDLAGKLHFFPLAQQLLDTMHSSQLPVNYHTIDCLLRRYVRAGVAESAISLFRQLPHYGLAHTPEALANLLAVLSKKRLAEDAQAVFDEFKDQILPDVVIYSSLVHSWCRAGRLDEAERVFAEMKQSGVAPNVYTYTAVIDAMLRAAQLARAQELLCQMIDAGCAPSTATFNAFMRAHVKTGRAEQVLQVNNQMKYLGVEPDIITFNFLIEVHCRKGQKNLEAALKVLSQMVAKGCSPNCNSFNPIFKLVLATGNMGVAHSLYERMRELDCKPNVVTYNLLMRLFNEEKSMDMVLRMKKEMDAEGVEPNVNTYAALIEAFCGRGNWRRAYATIMEMVDDKNIKPSKPVYEMVLQLLRKAGQLRRHEEVVESLAKRGFISDTANLALWH